MTVVIAAGYAARLYPLTVDRPKCLSRPPLLHAGRPAGGALRGRPAGRDGGPRGVAGAVNPEVRERLLQATYDCVARWGLAKTTVEDHGARGRRLAGHRVPLLPRGARRADLGRGRVGVRPLLPASLRGGARTPRGWRRSWSAGSMYAHQPWSSRGAPAHPRDRARDAPAAPDDRGGGTHTLVAAFLAPYLARHGMAEGTDLDARGRLPGPHGALLHQLAGTLGPRRPRAGGAPRPVRAAGRHPVSSSLPEPTPAPPCYRHPDRAASVLCGHCDRPICTDCMVAGARGLAVPAVHLRGGKALAPGAGLHPHEPRTDGRGGLHQPDALVLGHHRGECGGVLPRAVSVPTPGSSTGTAMWPAAVHVENQYYRAFTAMWLHANFLHIFFNMLALLIVGPARRGAPRQGALPRPLPDRRPRGERLLVPAGDRPT